MLKLKFDPYLSDAHFSCFDATCAHGSWLMILGKHANFLFFIRRMLFVLFKFWFNRMRLNMQNKTQLNTICIRNICQGYRHCWKGTSFVSDLFFFFKKRCLDSLLILGQMNEDLRFSSRRSSKFELLNKTENRTRIQLLVLCKLNELNVLWFQQQAASEWLIRIRTFWHKFTKY